MSEILINTLIWSDWRGGNGRQTPSRRNCYLLARSCFDSKRRVEITVFKFIVKVVLKITL